MKLKKEQLQNIRGGINITGTMVSSFVRILDIFLDVGRSLGSAIRRVKDQNACPY